MKYEFKGTKGEWSIRYGEEVNGIEHESFLASIYSTCGMQFEIASVFNDGYSEEEGETKDTCIANAHLIAASPDLLQACIDVINVLPSLDALPNVDTEMGRITKQVYVAINKALNIND